MKNIKEISYLLDQVRYKCPSLSSIQSGRLEEEFRQNQAEMAQHLAQTRVTREKWETNFRDFTSDSHPIQLMDGITIQNNRLNSLAHPCSGGCWYCVFNDRGRGSVLDRRRRMESMSLDQAVKILEKLRECGFHTLTFHGEDTLDDLEAFWRILETNHRGILVVTNGKALLREHGHESFFKVLFENFFPYGPAKEHTLDFVVSWDIEKVRRWAKEFEIPPGELVDRMQRVAVLYRNHSRKSLLVAFNDHLPADFNKLNVETQGKLGRLISGIESWTTRHDPLYTTPYVVEIAIDQGRAERKEGVHDLYLKMQVNSTLPLCRYTPFFDLATGEMATSNVRTEHPRRLVTEENCFRVLLAPFHNPRERHLYVGKETKRRVALVKQLGFALSLAPNLKDKKQASFQEVECHIFKDPNLMTSIELLFLLDDIILPEKKYFQFYSVPLELKETLLQKEILLGYLTYYSKYLPHTQKIPAEIVPYIKDDGSLYLNDFEKYVENRISTSWFMKELPEEEAIPPEGYLRTAYQGFSVSQGAW